MKMLVEKNDKLYKCHITLQIYNFIANTMKNKIQFGETDFFQKNIEDLQKGKTLQMK